MKLSLSRDNLANYITRQLEMFFPDGGGIKDLQTFLDVALDRLEYCFSHVRMKNFTDAQGPCFNHLHTDQYAILLYFLANTAFSRSPGHPVADKAYALNKALHGIDAYYEIGLPDIFAFQHPVGTVLGRASYSNYFYCYHNCTVGTNFKDKYPSFGEGVVLFGGSRIIGETNVGENTFIATGTIVIDHPDLPPNAIVHGLHPNVGVKPTARSVLREIFGLPKA